MDEGILVGFGLSIVAIVLLIGIVIALINLKDINRNHRSGSTDEHKRIQPPSIQSKRTKSEKKIEFGEMTDINKQSPKYTEDSYVEIKSKPAQTEHCPICRQSLSKGESVTCRNCGSRYHVHCFKEIKNICQNCKQVQP